MLISDVALELLEFISSSLGVVILTESQIPTLFLECFLHMYYLLSFIYIYIYISINIYIQGFDRFMSSQGPNADHGKRYLL